MTRSVLVTGVAGGIGSATAKAFSNAGYTVIGVDRQNRPVEGVSLFIQADIASDTDLIFDRIRAEIGWLDVLVNNAAVRLSKSLVETTPEEWDRVMASNLRAVLGRASSLPADDRHRTPVRHRQRQFGSRRPDQCQYRRLCRQQRRVVGADSCVGD